MPDRGWYADPAGTRELRWWNGEQWTKHVVDAGTTARDAHPAHPPPTPDPVRPPAGVDAPTQAPTAPSNPGPWLWAAIGGAGAVVLGSLSPWATATTVFGSIDVNGTQGDGVLTLLLALGAGGTLIPFFRGSSKRGLLVTAAILGGIALAICAYDFINIQNVLNDGEPEGISASVGWGLYLANAGSVALAGGAIIGIRELRRVPRPATAPGS